MASQSHWRVVVAVRISPDRETRSVISDSVISSNIMCKWWRWLPEILYGGVGANRLLGATLFAARGSLL